MLLVRPLEVGCPDPDTLGPELCRMPASEFRRTHQPVVRVAIEPILTTNQAPRPQSRCVGALFGVKAGITAGCIDTDPPSSRCYFDRSDKPLIQTAHVHHAMWVISTETRCQKN